MVGMASHWLLDSCHSHRSRSSWRPCSDTSDNGGVISASGTFPSESLGLRAALAAVVALQLASATNPAEDWPQGDELHP